MLAGRRCVASVASLLLQASITHAEKLPDPLCSRAMLICSIM
nr:MAG TPA_asm: hypothetical protein [Caudoviricetes sp.]